MVSSTVFRSAARNLQQAAAKLLCGQANLASYPQRDVQQRCNNFRSITVI